MRNALHESTCNVEFVMPYLKSEDRGMKLGTVVRESRADEIREEEEILRALRALFGFGVHLGKIAVDDTLVPFERRARGNERRHCAEFFLCGVDSGRNVRFRVKESVAYAEHDPGSSRGKKHIARVYRAASERRAVLIVRAVVYFYIV